MHNSLQLVPFQLDAAAAVSRWARESGRFAPWSEVGRGSAARRRGAAPIWVRVLPDNTAALACYSELGFMRASLDEERRYNEEGQSPGMRWLKLASPDAGP